MSSTSEYISINDFYIKKKKQRVKTQPISRTKTGFHTISSVYSVKSSVKMYLLSPDDLKPKLSITQHRPLFYEVQYQVLCMKILQLEMYLAEGAK